MLAGKDKATKILVPEKISLNDNSILEDKGDMTLKALSIKAGYRIACAEVVVTETGRKKLILLPVENRLQYPSLQRTLDARLEPIINDGHYEMADYWISRTPETPNKNKRCDSMAVYLKHTAQGRALNVELIRDVTEI